MKPTIPSRASQSGQRRPSANGNGQHKRISLSEETKDWVENFEFLWPTSDDATKAAQVAIDEADAILQCSAWSLSEKPKSLLGRDVVIVSPDTDVGFEEARRRAEQCSAAKVKVWVWRLPEYGPPHSRTFEEWRAKGGDISKALAFCRTEFVPFVPPPQGPPDFSSTVPRPITVDLVPVMALEPSMIPDSLREWILDIAGRASAPVEYAATAAIVALSGTIGCRLTIRPKKHDRWLVAPNLWGAVVGPPGVLKSPMVEEALRPLSRLAKEAKEDHEERMADWAAEQLLREARKTAAKGRLKNAVEKGKLKDEEQLRNLAREAADAHRAAQPSERRLSVNDVTIEKLQVLMAENARGLLYFRDELAGLLKSMDKQGHETDRKFFLECWGGLNRHRVERMGRDDVDIPRACLAMFGTIQPGPLARYVGGATSGEEDDGFMPRFQVLVYPDLPDKFTYVDRYPDTSAKSKAHVIFKTIHAMDPAALGCEYDPDQDVHFIGFDDDAQAFFVSWYTALENRLRSGILNHAMTCHLAKYRSLMPSLAGIFHLIDQVEAKESIEGDKSIWSGTIRVNRDGKLRPISLYAATLAAAWCDFLESHARRMYQSAADGDPSDAVRLADRIQESLTNPFTVRDVQRKGWAGLSSNDEVRRAIGILEDRGWVKVVEVPSSDEKGRGRPSEQVWINPKVMDRGSE